eukprot:SAG22_NODE_864_length_6788_cov_2.700553_5_plen_107_part_00
MSIKAPLYRKPLGPPLGPAAVTVVNSPGRSPSTSASTAAGAGGTAAAAGSNVIYRRKFAKGTSVLLNVTHNGGRNSPPSRCCILWGDGTNNTCNPGDCAGVVAAGA